MIIISSFVCGYQLRAEPKNFDVKISGRGQVVVTTSDITLSDIAEIKPTTLSGFDDGLIALSKIKIDRAAAPGTTTRIPGKSVVEAITRNGVNISKIGYEFPGEIIVQRASRKLRIEEVRPVIEEFLKNQSREAVLRDIAIAKGEQTFPGEIEMKVLAVSPSQNGNITASLVITNERGETIPTEVKAKIDEYRELPVTTRGLSKGSVIGSGDIARARFNVAELPFGSEPANGDLIGLEITRSLAGGQIIETGAVRVPPVITVGGIVTVLYRTDFFEATATGTALDAGAVGHEIRVRNDASKKIVKGTILEPGIVKVNP